MKKRYIALTLAVVLGGAWLGGSWYSGKLLAEQYPQLVERVNSEFAQVSLTSPYKLEYKTTKYNKHLFTTAIENQLVVTDTQENKSYTVPFKILVEHGPLPLSRLMTLHWLPVMASGNIELLNDPSISPIFAATNDKTPLKGDFTVGYDQTVAQTLNFAAINYRSEDGQREFTSTPFKFISDTDLNGIGKVETQIDSISITSLASDGLDGDSSPFKMTLSNVAVKSDYQPTEYKNIGVGTQKLTLDSLDLFDSTQADAKAFFSLKNLDANGDVTLDNDSVNVRSKLQADKVVLSGQDLGKLFYDIAFNHLDAKALDELMATIRNAQNMDEARLEHALQSAGMAFFQHQPELKLQPFSLTNSVGENKVTADIAFAQADWQKALMKGKVLSLFDRFAINADVNKPALTETVKALNMIDEDADAKTALSQAQADVDEMLQSAVAENILQKQSDEHYTLELKLDKGELKLNGTVIPEKDIANMLLMGILGAGFY
ncbi:YdgA family protein [Pasteurellaceae bacterium HPA106]|uniref:YdgA family protein n=1 Tax=Spirabiliibacterium pneumoniae TaxID=221400 RepID=UPI001AAD758C|nr:YdgA family protein [Spirabiliibacterium pneumoniae]MBE2895403.1 YdgA family protein [Spirabiliibacterium pneumoniae]